MVEQTPPQVPPKADDKAPVNLTPEQLHDAAISAVEAWKTNPTDDTKKAAMDAVAKAKESLKSLPKQKTLPEKYELKLPDGTKLDAKHLEGIATFSKERGLSNEEAQAIVEREHTLLTSYEKTVAESVKTEIESWAKSSEADKEIGGEKFKENVTLAKQVLDRFANDDFKKFLDVSGYGNHPEVLRFVINIGKAMTQDQLVKSTVPPTGEKKSTESVLYNNTPQT